MNKYCFAEIDFPSGEKRAYWIAQYAKRNGRLFYFVTNVDPEGVGTTFIPVFDKETGYFVDTNGYLDESLFNRNSFDSKEEAIGRFYESITRGRHANAVPVGTKTQDDVKWIGTIDNENNATSLRDALFGSEDEDTDDLLKT